MERQTLVYVPQAIQMESYTGPNVGLFVSDLRFTGGGIQADVTFSSISDRTLGEILLYYNPSTKHVVTAGLGRTGLYNIGGNFDTSGWQSLALTGERANLAAERTYHLKVSFVGSQVSLSVDGVDVLAASLPRSFAPSQVGVLLVDDAEIRIANFKTKTQAPKAFVVMEFGTPFDELYGEVIRTVCGEFGLDVIRGDEVYGPGLIIGDITREIIEAKLVVAEITPTNANVYFEVGFAHAWMKPTILLAQKGTDLPFDVSPFRVLFYEDTIAGKARIENGLRRHVTAIMS